MAVKTVFDYDIILYINDEEHHVADNACIRHNDTHNCYLCNNDYPCSESLWDQWETLMKLHERGEIHVSE